MSDEKKRGRSASTEAGKNKPVPAKRQRASRGEHRTVGRARDAFGTVFPALDGPVLSHPQSPRDVRNLYFNPEFGTGALGHQNSGVGATGDFNAFKEIVADTRVEHTANRGTALDKVALIRKARAINAAVPADRPIVSIDMRAKGK